MPRIQKPRVNGKRNATATEASRLQIPTSDPRPPTPGPSGGGFDAGVTQAQTNSNEPLFSPEQLEMLSFRRFNPFATFNAASLANALDSYLAGYLVPAARLWERLAKQQKTIRNVKAKREEAVALRPRVIERTDDSSEAYDQAFVLEHFYANARAGHALNRNVRGGFSKIVMQMMEAKSFGTAAHHLIWNPDSSTQIKLPSGASVPSLTAKFEYVPMEFFESRTGELRFLGMSQAYSGEPLQESAWLVTSEESPLMFAAAPLAYYDKLATSDNINFSEKFGTPGIVVHTTAQRGTPEGDSAVALARSLGSNYRGTQFGAAENKVEIVWPSGGTSGNSLPMHNIIEEVKRDLASLYLGADLSTQSRGQESVGASVQQEGEERRERADCAWISETLNAGIDVIVLRWYFGDAPVLARVSIDAPKNEDRKTLLELVRGMVELGADVPREPILKRLNVPQAKENEEVFEPPTPPATAGQGSGADDPTKENKPKGRRGDKKTATNVALTPEEELNRFLGPLVQDFRTAFADDLRPLGVALDAVLANDTINFDSKVAWLQSQLPSLATEILAAPKQAEPIAEIIRRSIEHGWNKAAEERLAA
jgi:hypothetical protein